MAGRRGRRGRGFSLIEMMLALAILAFGVLGMMAMQVKALEQGNKAKHTSTAAAIARDLYEQVPRMAYSDLNIGPTDPSVNGGWAHPGWLADVNGEVDVQITDAAANTSTEQTFTVWHRIAPDPTVPPNSDIRFIDLEVVWNETEGAPNKPTRTGLPTVRYSGIIVNNDR
jgi:prepilin-type N-terminal cleavage/methylation domain-containing protein